MAAAANTPSDFEPTTAPRTAPREVSWFWTVVTWTHIAFWMITGGCLGVLVGGAAALFGDRKRRVAHAMLAFAYRAIVGLHPIYRLRLSGLENLPKGPCILCPNHQSYADVVYLYSLPLQFKWVIKKELFRLPLFGAAMRVAGYPAIDRGDPESAHALMHSVSRWLRAGVPVLSFPQGTRSPTSELGTFQGGPARMAILNQVPLVPVGVAGTGDLLPRGGVTFPRRCRTVIHVGKPIMPEGTGPRAVRQLTRELREAVAAAITEAATLTREGRDSRM